MENTNQNQPITPPPSSINPGRSFGFFKGFLAALILFLVAGGSYLAGTQNNKLAEKSTLKPTQQVAKSESSPRITQPIETIGNPNWITFTNRTSEDGGYTIMYPDVWKPTLENSNGVTNTLTLKNSDYSIQIYIAPMGGGGCIFEGEVPEGPYSDLRDKQYTELTINGKAYRRFMADSSNDPNKINLTQFDFCGSQDGINYGSPTEFGVITYSLPKTFDKNMLEEMDSIVKTLRNKK